MTDKRYPKDLQDIFQATRSDMEVQLADAENFVLATNSKSFDVVLAAVTDTTNLVGGFVNDKSSIIEKSAKNGKVAVDNLAKAIQSINSLQTKLHGTDKSKELIVHKQHIAKELEAEVFFALIFFPILGGHILINDSTIFLH